MSDVYSMRTLLAVQTVLFIAYHGQNGNPIKSHQMIDRYKLSNRALEPILQKLAKAGIVESKQGANGGYMVAKPERVRVADIVRLFTPEQDKKSLLFSDMRNVLFPTLKEGYHSLLGALESTTVAQLMQEAKEQGVPKQAEAALDFII